MKPPTRKNRMYATVNRKAVSMRTALLAKVSVQFTTLIVAGREIIIVTVLYKLRLR